MAKQRYKMNMKDGSRDNGFMDLEIYRAPHRLPRGGENGSYSACLGIAFEECLLKASPRGGLEGALLFICFQISNIDDSQLESFGDKASGIHTRSLITSEQTVHKVVLSLLQ